MASQQQEQMALQTGDNPPKHKLSKRQQIMKDFRRLPDGMRPTPFYVLHEGESILLVHHGAANEKLQGAQRKLILAAMQFNGIDQQGTITAVHCRGYGPVLREVTIWDHQGERTEPMHSADFEQFIADWRRDHA